MALYIVIKLSNIEKFMYVNKESFKKLLFTYKKNLYLKNQVKISYCTFLVVKLL